MGAPSFPEVLKPQTPSVVESPSVNSRVVSKSWKGKPIKYLLHMMPLHFWKKLAQSVNSVMTKRITEGRVSKSYRSRFAGVDEVDMIHFFANVLYIGNASSRQLPDIQQILHNVDNTVKKKRGIHRFHAIMTSLVPTNDEFDELTGIIVHQSVSAVNVGNSPIISIDESLYDYQENINTQNKKMPSLWCTFPVNPTRAVF